MHKPTILFTGAKSSLKDLKVGNVKKTSIFFVPSEKCDNFLQKGFLFRVMLSLTDIWHMLEFCVSPNSI